MTELFEQASRERLRFATVKGFLSVEDLWDLPLNSDTGKLNLYAIGNEIHSKLKEKDGAPFFSEGKKTDAAGQMAFDIVKRVIEVRTAEAKARSEEKERAAKKQQILGLLSDKENEAMKGKSADELRAMLAAL